MNYEDKMWTDEHINKTLDIIRRAKETKSEGTKLMDKVVYWGVLFVAIIGNLILSIFLIPFMLVLKNYILYIIIFMIAFVFGLFFSLLLREIEQLDYSHHIIAGLFIPALAIINVFYMTNFANYLTATIKLNNIHNPFLIGIVYTIAFITPYLFSKIKDEAISVPAY